MGQSSNKAKKFCEDCPVRIECLEFALIYNEYGVFGGTSESERHSYPDFIISNLRVREATSVGLEVRGHHSDLTLEDRLIQAQIAALSLEVLIPSQPVLADDVLALVEALLEQAEELLTVPVPRFANPTDLQVSGL
jgi:hypothetical protein